MKKIVILIMLFIIVTIFQYKALQGKIGCMDNSKHLDISDGYDYKTYHYVECTCPCDQYSWSYNRGRCENCWHFHSTQQYVLVD